LAQLHALSSDRLLVAIGHHGAELQSLRTHDGCELLWQGDPAVWGRRSPSLFPIVGRLKDDALLHKGRRYSLSKHGFARDRDFQLESADASRAVFVLKDDTQTRAHYPFAFELRLEYALHGNGLSVTYRVRNPDTEPLYVSLGAHPAFVWPLAPGVPREAHSIVFMDEETAPIRRLNDGLIAAQPIPTPVEGRTLKLRDGLFADDALIFDRLRSRRLSYSAPGTPVIRVDFEDFPHLGIWTKPGAGYICIEPWQGYDSPEQFAGEFRDKPGVVALLGGRERSWRYSIHVDP
jgi:galactose mutarotase-like enzyme